MAEMCDYSDYKVVRVEDRDFKTRRTVLYIKRNDLVARSDTIYRYSIPLELGPEVIRAGDKVTFRENDFGDQVFCDSDRDIRHEGYSWASISRQQEHIITMPGRFLARLESMLLIEDSRLAESRIIWEPNTQFPSEP